MMSFSPLVASLDISLSSVGNLSLLKSPQLLLLVANAHLKQRHQVNDSELSSVKITKMVNIAKEDNMYDSDPHVYMSLIDIDLSEYQSPVPLELPAVLPPTVVHRSFSSSSS